jgi:hypothetical protein
METEKSVGKVIWHDITKIEKGSFKGPLFKKGHCIREEDVPVLLDLGKNRIYSIELEPGDLHEDEAGLRLARAVSGPGLELQGPSEGRFNLVAARRGLLKVDVAKLNRVNQIKDIVVSTLHTNIHVEGGEKVAGAKVIPLVVGEPVLRRVEAACAGSPVLAVMPYRKIKPALVITGREVAEGRIKDGFASVLAEKALFYGMEAPLVDFAVDDPPVIAGKISAFLEKGCSLIIVTGGMSVDPDDVTPAGIAGAGARVVKYGAPVLPGAMFLLAYKGTVPVIGLPACAMYFQNTVLDVILPRLLAGEILKARDISNLGHGGLCRGCDRCSYPHCSFGKGGVRS